jgi:aldose sugar dehydrogenase
MGISIVVLVSAFGLCILVYFVPYLYAQQNNTELLDSQPSYSTLAELNWTNNNKDKLSLAIVTNIQDPTNVTLMVDIKQHSSEVQITNSSWSVISTDYIPVNENAAYNFSLGVSAKDVNQLHSKIYFFDSNKTEISSDFIFGGKDGTFKGNFSKVVSSPSGAKYSELQMWVRQTLGKEASYLLHYANISTALTTIPNTTLNSSNTGVRTPFIVNSESNFRIESVFTGINDSTSMAFLGPNDILVLEKNTGKVNRIVNGQLKDTLIDLDSFHKDGLLGIATSESQSGSTYVFLFYNEAPSQYGADIENMEEATEVNSTLGYNREGDRLVRYELIENKLTNPELLFELKAQVPSKNVEEEHHGGELIIGPDNAIYVVIGDLDGWRYDVKTKAQNYIDGGVPDGRAGIIRITQDGKPYDNGLLGNTYPLNLYYAYGIRNSFGMDFDPVTGNLWDTENGPDYGDEINLVKPGFNSGSDIVQGISTEFDKLGDLEDFDGRGIYSDPEFVWTIPVAPTAINFLDSKLYGPEYENDMFVADVNNGNIYHFDLNENRTELSLIGPLKDKVADKPSELDEIAFARGFGGITDLQVGPDGYLYVLTLEDYTNEKYAGTIYRILPNK